MEFIQFMLFALLGFMLGRLIAGAILKGLAEQKKLEKQEIPNKKEDMRPCPPAPHKWEWRVEPDEYGENREIIRCTRCKKRPGEIE